MFLQRCDLLRDTLDEPAITTDILVGFPGETEEEFQQTCAASRAAGFSKIHIFPFSPRRGTPAAEMSDQVHGDVKADRRRRLAAVERELQQNYFQSLVGRRLQVLVESPAEAGRVAGTSCRYAPVELSEASSDTPPGELPESVEGRLIWAVPSRVSGRGLMATAHPSCH